MKVVTAAEMRSIERRADEQGHSIPSLIERAGRALDAAARRLAPHGLVLVLAGPGNNGSDGLTAARRMFNRGESVVVYTFRRHDVRDYSGPAVSAESDTEGTQLEHLLSRSAVVVDALLGTGQSRPAEGTLARILEIVTRSRSDGRRYLAVDVPTGVDSDSGRVLGPVFHADVTLCMGFPKRGTFIYPGAEHVGRMEVASLGIEPDLALDVRVSATSDADIAALLPARRSDGNKGSSGRLLTVGGSADFVGAPMLVALGAYRVGAGLVEVGIPSSTRDAVSAHGLEPVYRLLPERDGKIAPEAAGTVVDAAGRADAIAIGPGMSLSDSTVEFLRRLLPALAREKSPPALIDADGLNALARIDRWWEPGFPRILTPHPGEMARLTGKSIADVQADRIGTAKEFAARWQAVVLLKGAGTVIAAPDGDVTINTTGGPNLATAGTGDVLSGIIGGLLAQGCPPYAAGVAGAYIHGQAGDIIRQRRGDAGTLASDLLDVIPIARKSLLEGETRES